MKPRYILIMIFCFTLSIARAQGTKEEIIKKFAEKSDYRIGEQLPDFGELKIINVDQSSINLADYRDRLLILDFWNRGCSSCIEAMPKMDAMQKQFANTIKILPIASESKDVMETLWRNNRKLRTLNLTSVVEAGRVRDYFAHLGDPYEVWIYKGKIIGITYHEYVDAKNITQVLSGKIPDWPVRNDFYKLDSKKQFVSNQMDTASIFTTYTLISNYRKVNGVAILSESTWNVSGIVRDSTQEKVSAYFINKPIYQTYLYNWICAGGDLTKLVMPATMVNPNAIIWEVSDRSKYIYERKRGTYYGDWLRKNGICYESVKKDNGQTDQQIYKSINEDLNNLLSLNVRWEKRKEKVLILIRTTKEDRLKSKTNSTYNPINGDWSIEQQSINGTLYQYRNTNLPIADAMNQQESNPYVFDETKYEGMVDMDLNISSWTDIDAVRKAIAPYGLALKEEERSVDKLVFSEVIDNRK